MQLRPAPPLDDFIEDGGLNGHFKGENQPDAPQSHGFRCQPEPYPGADDPEKAHNAVGNKHDSPGVSRAAQGHFHHDAGGEEGFHHQHGAQHGDSGINEGRAAVGKYLHEQGGKGAEEHSQACHEDDGVPHAFPDGDAGHKRVPGAQVLPHECGSGHADGEAGQEAERFNADGNIVDAQHAFNRQFTDDGKAKHLDAPHAEDFHGLRQPDFQDALLHAHVRPQMGKAEVQGRGIVFSPFPDKFFQGFIFPAREDFFSAPQHDEQEDAHADSVAADRSCRNSSDAPAAQRSVRKDEDDAEDDIEDANAHHDPEGKPRVSGASQGGIDGKDHAAERGRKCGHINVLQGVGPGGFIHGQYVRDQEIAACEEKSAGDGSCQEPQHGSLVQAMLGLGIVPGARHAGNDGCGSHHDRPLDDEAEPHDEDDGAHAVRDVDGVLGVHPYFSGDEKVGRGDEKAQQLFQEWPESNDGDLPGQG